MSSSPEQGGYTAESATCIAWGLERLTTAWVRMHDRKDGSAGVGWDGCTQPTETKATKQGATFVIREKKRKNNNCMTNVLYLCCSL